MSDEESSLARFTRTAEVAAGDVIGTYSTSFGLATKLLGRRHRQHVRNIYALVRVADEIVDGVAAEAGLTVAEQAETLERYVADTHRAMVVGYSSDLVIHAFARTARAAGIDESLTQPFFDSMRADLGEGGGAAEVQAGGGAFSGPEPATKPDSQPAPDAQPGAQQRPAQLVYDTEAHARYVHGSAEVVGLMCLRVFLRGRSITAEERDRLESGARQLGAAFQNINFLRDLADDTDRLGRSYLSVDESLSDADRDAWVRTVRAQLDDARAVIPLLPKDARAAVRSALALFAALTDRVERTPAANLYRTRVRVPDPVKAGLAARALISTWMERDT
ncbi:phytoene/squalene synthase family protein [Leucobacter sp. W1478]|uniref:phytoene/squalene synthase family protein n=1 Tax=Leucobacter sp. W1478 TaxID=3439065 RepID=UPI003F3DD6E7